jgi:hypothetical protein
MLTIACLGVAVISYAAVNIPYTFTTGTTISSSQVNSNFTTLANAINAIQVGTLDRTKLYTVGCGSGYACACTNLATDILITGGAWCSGGYGSLATSYPTTNVSGGTINEWAGSCLLGTVVYPASGYFIVCMKP